MTEEVELGSVSAKPIQNMRITLWGVQGSCAVFPSPHGVQEYSRRLAVYTLTKAMEDMQHKSRNGPCTIEELLGGPATHQAIENYQRRIGLPDMPFYGGETTCIEVETAEGNKIIFDAGSGIRRCSLEIAKAWESRPTRTLHIFATHEHLDHRSGLTFARFCYVEPNPFTLHIYGSYQYLYALDQHYGLFSQRVSDTTYIDDPVDYSLMTATFVGTELRRDDDTTVRGNRHWEARQLAKPIRIGGTIITPFEVYHVIPCCLGYKVEHNGKTFVFCTDHELRRGPDPDHPRQQRSMEAEARVLEHCRNADVAYFDGQYFLEEYLGRKGIGSYPPVSRLDWGHGCVEDALDRAVKCNIRRTFVGHHDPERTWPERVEIDRQLTKLSEGKPNRIQLADGDAVIDL